MIQVLISELEIKFTVLKFIIAGNIESVILQFSCSIGSLSFEFRRILRWIPKGIRRDWLINSLNLNLNPIMHFLTIWGSESEAPMAHVNLTQRRMIDDDCNAVGQTSLDRCRYPTVSIFPAAGQCLHGNRAIYAKICFNLHREGAFISRRLTSSYFERILSAEFIKIFMTWRSLTNTKTSAALAKPFNLNLI